MVFLTSSPRVHIRVEEPPPRPQPAAWICWVSAAFSLQLLRLTHLSAASWSRGGETRRAGEREAAR